jgi:hypothetical protein
MPVDLVGIYRIKESKDSYHKLDPLESFSPIKTYLHEDNAVIFFEHG